MSIFYFFTFLAFYLFIFSPYGHMKATLLHLVLNKTAILLTHIIKYLTQDKFQRIVAYLTATGAVGILYCLITVITDIYCCAIKVARILSSITVMTAQLGHILLRTEHAGHDETMQGHAFYLQTVKESLTDILQKNSCTWYQIWNTAMQGVYIIIR